jgi:hypothetical protein
VLWFLQIEVVSPLKPLCQSFDPQVKLLIMKGVIGGRAVQTYGSRVGAQQGGLNCMFLDHDKPVKEQVSLPNSASNSTPCDLDSEDDQDENDLVVETRAEDDDDSSIHRRDDSENYVANYPRFTDVFHALAEAVNDIENVMLAGHAANIVLHAVHMISELKSRAASDMVNHGASPFTRLLDDGFSNSLKQGRQLMDQPYSGKLRNTWGREDFEMHPMMDSEENLVQSVPQKIDLFRQLRGDRYTSDSGP